MLSAEEEADINRLIAPVVVAGVAPPAAPSQNLAGVTHAPADHIRLRERLILGVACGSNIQIEVAHSEVDFSEPDESGTWSACVSVVLRLKAWGRQVHDETGTGRVTVCHDQATAEAEAGRKAIDSGARRLAKRFAPSLGQQALGRIEQQVRASGGR